MILVWMLYINKETTQYFSLLKDVLDACDLVDNPGLIYNVDESGVYHSTLRSTLRPRMWWPREVQRKCDIGQAKEIDINVCCTCFISYKDDFISGSGMDWISCSCRRWLHEDCAEDCVIDQDGKERMCTCPYCLDILA